MREEQVLRSGSRIALIVLTLSVTPFQAHATSAGPRGADIGAYLQAGARLRQALVGRRAATRLALPGSCRGLVIRPEARHPLDEKACRTAIREYGEAYAAGDSVTISDVRVSRGEIAVWMGPGGYDEKVLRDPGARMADERLRGLPSDLQEKGGDPTTCRTYTEEEYRRYQDAVREAQHQAEDARQEAARQRRMSLARATGTRIRIVFKKEVPLERIEEGAVREMIAGCLAFPE